MIKKLSEQIRLYTVSFVKKNEMNYSVYSTIQTTLFGFPIGKSYVAKMASLRKNSEGVWYLHTSWLDQLALSGSFIVQIADFIKRLKE